MYSIAPVRFLPIERATEGPRVGPWESLTTHHKHHTIPSRVLGYRWFQ